MSAKLNGNFGLVVPYVASDGDVDNAPNTSHRSLYLKNDDKLYTKDNTGAVLQITDFDNNTGIAIPDVASDGDVDNAPDADHVRLYLKSDELWYKDNLGNTSQVTNVSSGGGGGDQISVKADTPGNGSPNQTDIQFCNRVWEGGTAGALFDPSTPNGKSRFKAPTDGHYIFTFSSLYVSASATNDEILTVTLKDDTGDTLYTHLNRFVAGGVFSGEIFFSVEVQLDSGDYVTVSISSSDGINSDISLGTNDTFVIWRRTSETKFSNANNQCT